ncbi:baseplate J/gp47 family protein [Azotobacter chroococcum]|uniref:Phage-related baseplate assembly protein n=1 Tax=Azotobacter chroococcum TaxID=353 RepID=A0A4R1PMN2_9GAMM|nr:baseplate J/gp47 family protein [Azotobacter chroococcum]TBV91314.1 baseplate assembly protein [Azotobacter chroococcum]TCL32532.1 phage-related baseplate assembly protein [Azotobacter chroococcum]
MSQFVAIDLSQIPAPKVVETLDFEQILAERKATLVGYYPADEQAAVAAQLELESDPRTKMLEESTYRELVLRARINDAAKAVMLAYAEEEDLDQLGGNFSVKRLEISPADPEATPPVAAVYESDTDFRYRIQLSMEGLSVAGPEGAYIFHALSASGLVLDASATSPTPGEVVVTVLSREGDGTASAELLASVDSALSAESVRPLTDYVQVQAATVVPYQVEATLRFLSGPDRTVVMAAAQAAIEAYTEGQHRLGLDVTLSGLYAALHQPGVQRVDLASPTANLVIDRQSASYCTAITLTDGGLDE